MRRVRASFLLRCVILAACVAAFLTVLWLCATIGWIVGFVVFAVVLWFGVIEIGLLPMLIELIVVRRARRSGKPVDSIWFVDTEANEQRDQEQFFDDTRDNPTIR